MQTLSLKPGESFVVSALASDGTTPLDLTGYSIRSQVRDRAGVLMLDVSVIIDADQVANRGRYVLDFDKSITKNFTPGELRCNVRYEHVSEVFSTENFIVQVEPAGITQ